MTSQRDAAEAVVRLIASQHPRPETDEGEPGQRCRHCGYRRKLREPMVHSENCAYARCTEALASLPAAREGEPVANSICTTCLGFGYLRKAPSTCDAGGDLVPCPVCRQSPGGTTIAPAPSDQEKLVDKGLEQIAHSIKQARLPGNDWKRELALIENTVAEIARARQNGGEG